MKNKISMSTLRGFSVADSVKFALECGFDGLEIQTDYLSGEDEIRKALNAGLDVSLHAPCGDINISALNKGICQESVNQVKLAIDLASKFNLRVVTFHPGRLSSARENITDKWELLLESVQDIADYAKERKVYIAIENMELRKKELVFSVDDLNKFEFISKNNIYFGVTLDFSHFATNKIYPQNITGLRLPVYNVHISQCVGGKPHFPLYDAGEIEMPDVIKILGNYNSSLVVELKSVFDREVYINSRKELLKLK